MFQSVRIFSRFVRSTFFLASLFTFSFVYFIIKSGFLVWLVRNYISSAVSLTLITFRKSSPDLDSQMLDKLIAHRHIQWLADKSQLQDYNMTSGTNIPVFCRNTRQGRTIVTDDQGYTCERAHLMANGCCEVSVNTSRFSCSGCETTPGCCALYEDCVACCMKPEQKNVLLEMIRNTSGHRLRQILAATDQFELCLLKCRTSSNSVHLENKYKSEKLKYCYKQEPLRPYRYFSRNYELGTKLRGPSEAKILLT
ncbi:unnamed protein product [Enterobius vermicularis]|uniref:SREBP regulating gene protein n=1 Tax=Enterobius vermicularis TaxID=51028 RepID=A0A0N4VHK1_ENTVE|nr:unnamed protein product [Enterobius vermicularis]